MKKSLVESIQNNLNEDENNESLLEQMSQWIKDHPKDGLDIARTINSYDGSLDYLDYWENDEEFFNTYYPENAMEAVRAACYGDYNYTDDYVRINAYGNLESVDEYGLEDEVQAYSADIVEQLIDNWDRYQDYLEETLPEEFKTLLKQHIATRPGPSEE